MAFKKSKNVSKSKEFLLFLDEMEKKGIITEEEKDSYIYDCAYAQSYGNNLYEVMQRISNEINSKDNKTNEE